MRNIRQWTLDDASDLSEALNNRKVQNNLRDGIPLPYQEKDGIVYINSVLSAPKDSQYSFAIVKDGRAIGSIGIFRKDNIHRLTGEMGYYVAQGYWGQGIASNAIKEACSYVFEHTDIIRIFAEPFADNIGSCRALEKSGFVLEGTLTRNAIKNGAIIDMKLYALVRPD